MLSMFISTDTCVYWMNTLRYITLLLTISLHSQVIVNHDVTMLNTLPSDWTMGNGCGVDNYIDVFVLGDLVLKGNCYLNNAKLTVHGYIIYNGFEIGLKCSNDELIELGSLGVDSASKDVTIVYPNPVIDFIYTTIKEQYSLSVYDMNGKLVSESNNVKRLASGLYIVMIRTEYKNYTAKIIIK